MLAFAALITSSLIKRKPQTQGIEVLYIPTVAAGKHDHRNDLTVFLFSTYEFIDGKYII